MALARAISLLTKKATVTVAFLVSSPTSFAYLRAGGRVAVFTHSE